MAFESKTTFADRRRDGRRQGARDGDRFTIVDKRRDSRSGVRRCDRQRPLPQRRHLAVDNHRMSARAFSLLLFIK